jgi:23S rRNA pseudouridine2605 synthase
MSEEHMSEAHLVRLAKLIARRGVASRREAERMIADGEVMVDGQVVKTPIGVDPRTQVVKVNGQNLPPEPHYVYYVMYKPRGYITGRDDPEGRKGVLDLVDNLPARVEPVGRLDYETEGALLLTNDGELAHQLTHPSRNVPKRYLVKVYRTPDPEKLRLIEEGKVFLEDGPVKNAKARIVESTDSGNTWVEVTVTEGRNRLIRRLFQQLHHPVSKLRRESFATISIRGMERGQVRRLTGAEVQRLHEIAEGKRPQRAGRSLRKKGYALPKIKDRPQGRKRREAAKRKKGG